METQMLMFLAMCSAISPRELLELYGSDCPSRWRYALVKYGGGILDMTGSIGGQVHSRNRYGKYIRARVVPVNPNTDLQNAVRAAIAYLTAYWSSTLTAADRTAWGLYADNVAMKNKLGETIHLSGFNHFIRSNHWRRRISATPIAAGPVVFELPAQDTTFAIAASEATQVITATYDAGLDWANETGGFLQVFQGQPQNGQRNFFGGPWRYVWAVSGADGAPPAGPAPIDVTFAIAEGQHQWVYARILRADGRLSEIFRADVIVAA